MNINLNKTSAFFLFVCFLCTAPFVSRAVEQNKNSDRLLIAEGEIKRISKLADPAKSDYPDCYFMAEFHIHSVLSGDMTESVINLAIPGFTGYKYTEYARLKQNDLLKVQMVSEENAAKKEKATQCSDDLNLFENNIYYLRKAEIIPAFTQTGEKSAVRQKKYTSKWNVPLNEKLSPKAIRERERAIQQDLEQIRTSPQESSIDRKTMQKLFKSRTDGLPLFKGSAFWFQNGTGVFAVVPYSDQYIWDQQLSRAAIQDNLPALVALDRFLKTKNVDLIWVLYPRWTDLGMRALIPETLSIPIRKNSEITRYLLEHDVEVVDLAPEMIKMIPRSEFLLYYYHLNCHPGWETQDLAGRLTAQRLERYCLPKPLDQALFRESRIEARDKQYVYPASLPIAGNVPGTPIMTNVTFYDGKWTQSNDNSPVLTWGNSFLSWPKNWAFVTALAKYSLQFSTICYGAGCYTTMLKNLLMDPEAFLTGKKVMIIPINVDMIEDYKIWNIATLDQRFSEKSRTLKTIPVKIPESESNEETSAVRQLAQKDKVNGVAYYILKEKPLEIELPEITKKSGCSYYVNVCFYDQNRVKIQLNQNEFYTSQSSLFAIDLARFPYEGKSILRISAVHKSAVLFISSIEIAEIRNDEAQK